ncbi:MAG: DSD1 family PLP-dependent enzyme [Gammaproteobacteria bacterium]|jgi:D-serine deaminase-like pyridoxal phosphate-dependent protein|nr:DSD1 family PLP-dependent enzyme [Gammaproteobacteria bacterium]MBP6052530.1 DSD1 family PLP-dependent enzyme [Pseudomonadales bacterium]MBK6583089.1 DSD1 family PLP-dependent enzyme [Gammaproteobacteria bacterium]MBK7519218.1 DSD1 family PLP-dependent enzyme [Gammaproteobacteria bacterium]MBK7730042.1 DSD1 family PLP-dependent enzyme [Gammaproteobacteria bacterium]
MQRRHFLYALIAAGTGSLLLRPADRGAPHDGYFAALNRLLRDQGPGRPVLVVDLARLERNCERLARSIAPGKDLRIVAKSLPSIALLEQVLRATGSRRVMGFHQPFLNALASSLPQTDLLLGKPMPVRAAEQFYRKLANDGAFDPRRQLQWLIDTPQRLAQYTQLARTLGTRLRINLEIDVGLHRGGLTEPQQLDALLVQIAAEPAHLEFAGLMGYDAHIGKVPPLLESRARSLERSSAIYRNFAEQARAHGLAAPETLTLNGAGSPTFRLHGPDSPLNEVAVGSALLKPADFDLDLLADFEPAAFIATPVLKALDGLQLPGPAPLGEMWALWDRNRRRSFFIYGGKWMARFASPTGLLENPLFGTSSNQAIVNASAAVDLAVDDYLFLRPTQSEAVLLQFGDLLAVRDEAIAGWWPVLSPGHESGPAT